MQQQLRKAPPRNLFHRRDLRLATLAKDPIVDFASRGLAQGKLGVKPPYAKRPDSSAGLNWGLDRQRSPRSVHISER
ncbi:hypothetical protein GCM10022204_36080 [Microlunatus aurantiacus]|uniref:Uncharacterized protein n=1 Tax=Microlunatus aurantiacus TaxID=446786 RepID=A0ABP7E6E1_9ACTN